MSKFVTTCPAVLSVIGWHAGESVDDIVRRKCADIGKIGSTVSVYQSWKARVPAVQKFGSVFSDPTVYFIEGKAFATGTEHSAQELSADCKNWDDLPIGIGKVTGKLPGGALVIGSLSAVHDHEIDLWVYVEHPALQPPKFQRGASAASRLWIRPGRHCWPATSKRGVSNDARVAARAGPGANAGAALHGCEVIYVMMLLVISGAVLICAMIWVAMTSSEEGQQRDHRVERDYDLRRERRWP